MTQSDLLANLESLIQDADRADMARVIGTLEQAKALAWWKMLAEPAPATQKPEALLTVADVAKQLNMSGYRIYELCRTRTLKSQKCGKSVRVTPSAVAEYLAKQGA